MANNGTNQLIISGDRLKIFNLFSTSILNFSKYKICEINNNQFCTTFKRPLDDSKQFIQNLSKHAPALTFQLFYADKLLSCAQIITISGGDMVIKEQNLNLTLEEMKQNLKFYKAFKDIL